MVFSMMEAPTALICQSPWTLPELVLTCGDRLTLYHSVIDKCYADGRPIPHFKELFPDDSMEWPESYRTGIS